MYRIGLALRKRYETLLSGSNSSQILAFSSSVSRCVESMSLMLKGLFNPETTAAQTLKHLGELDSNSRHPNSGFGSIDEWKSIEIDTKTVPSLIWSFVNNCTYRAQHPRQELASNPEIRALVGIEELRHVIMEKYKMPLDYSIFGLFSTIKAELEVERSLDTINYTDYFSDWIQEPVEDGSPIQLLDVLEEASIIGYRDQNQGIAETIQMAPIVTSIIESQKVALGLNSAHESRYKHKKMILYSSHDSSVISLLYELGIIDFESSFEKRFKSTLGGSYLDKFLRGIKLPNYGTSIAFELWLIDAWFPVVRVNIYSQADAKLKPVEFEPVALGSVCRRKYLHQNPGRKLSEFYPKEPLTELDKHYECPFGLFRNVTSALTLGDAILADLCDNKMIGGFQ